MDILTDRKIDTRQPWTIKERSEFPSYLSQKDNYFSNSIFKSYFQFYYLILVQCNNETKIRSFKPQWENITNISRGIEQN